MRFFLFLLISCDVTPYYGETGLQPADAYIDWYIDRYCECQGPAWDAGGYGYGEDCDTFTHAAMPYGSCVDAETAHACITEYDGTDPCSSPTGACNPSEIEVDCETGE